MSTVGRSSTFAVLRPPTTTVLPSAANRRASASPIPDVPPTIRTVRFEISMPGSSCGTDGMSQRSGARRAAGRAPLIQGVTGPPSAGGCGVSVSLMDHDTDTNRLGTYLRARRELVTPEQAGIPAGFNRRVPGLRREEVAMLAGISADYYLRLERGRDKNPSPQVLESLARVLRLDELEQEYLLGLTASRPRPRRRPKPEKVPARLHQLLAGVGVPAFVEGRAFDV